MSHRDGSGNWKKNVSKKTQVSKGVTNIDQKSKRKPLSEINIQDREKRNFG